MESNKNKLIIEITVVIAILLIVFTTYLKVNTIHEQNLIKVTEKEMVEAAVKCIKESKCDSEKVTLSELYQNNYLKEMADPLSKEVYDYNSYIKKLEDEYTFVKVS